MSSSLYHLVDAALWAACENTSRYEAASLAAEGFIHFSERDQVEGSAARFFADHDTLIVVRVDATRLHAELRYEEADGQRFPHLYGALNLDAVIDAEHMCRDQDGRFRLPARF